MRNKIDIEAVLHKVDEYYGQNRGADAERLMQEVIAETVEAEDDESLLRLLNELLGYYRETSQVDNSYAIAKQCIGLAKRMGLEDTLPYATTLLNIANAYRAGGRLEASLDLYLEVRRLYEKLLDPDDMLVASMENNLSLLYQEMGRFADSKESLMRALSIVETKKDADFEVAVTHANLAASCLNIGESEAARRYAEASMKEFEKLEIEDAHYGAALSALGTYYYQKSDYVYARQLFEQAMDIMEKNLGRNEFYMRLKENAEACKAAEGKSTVKGMELARKFYEQCGKPMIAEKFPAYEDRIATGLAGKGSDCFGYDDAQSADHDWGPEFCMWVTEDTYAEIGKELEAAYAKLPDVFMGYRRMEKTAAKRRRGVFTISGFFRQLIDAPSYENVDWQETPDYALASVVNGEIFRDDEGIFTAERNKFINGFPEGIRYLKMADSAAKFSQTGQYNYKRMLHRNDEVTAKIMMADCAREAMKLQHYIENRYPPHDKWLYHSICSSENGRILAGLLEKLPESVEKIGTFLAEELYAESFISDSDNYLDAHSDELSKKAAFAACSNERLVDWIAEVEFEAFDKVKNAGGRADCQNDWATFSIMRKSQYMTYNRTMLIQYMYDFTREYARGHNLIEEKYGRMMESTAPVEYEAIKDNFPIITPEKKAIIEQIVQMQVDWMEEFAGEYPALADNARSIRSSEDNIANTSYETYLRGEISTYSDKMLELYGRYVVEYARNGKNLTYAIMENSVHLYGYKDLDAAERFMKL